MVILDCARIGAADLRSIQALARATLRARRAGLECRLLYVSRELRQLISLCGLDGVLRATAGFPPRG